MRGRRLSPDEEERYPRGVWHCVVFSRACPSAVPARAATARQGSMSPSEYCCVRLCLFGSAALKEGVGLPRCRRCAWSLLCLPPERRATEQPRGAHIRTRGACEEERREEAQGGGEERYSALGGSLPREGDETVHTTRCAQVAAGRAPCCSVGKRTRCRECRERAERGGDGEERSGEGSRHGRERRSTARSSVLRREDRDTTHRGASLKGATCATC